MWDRVTPRFILNAHFKGLTNRDYSNGQPESKPDYVSRVLLPGIPAAVALVVYLTDAKLPAPQAILTMYGLLTGALFMAFTRMTSWRDDLTERQDELEQVEMPKRDAIDEAAAHTLMAIYLAFAAVVATVVGMNVQIDKDGAVLGISAAIIVFLASYTVAVLLLVIPTLYDGYVTTNKVRSAMSGHVFGKSPTRHD